MALRRHAFARLVNDLLIFGGDLYMSVEPSGGLTTVWKRPLSEMTSFKPESTIVEAPSMKFLLYQNYPNPFNLSTTIEYDLQIQTHVVLEIYNILGQRIRTVVNETEQAGHYSVALSAATLPSGVLPCRLMTSEFTQTRKLLLVR